MLGGLPYKGIFISLRLAGKGRWNKAWVVISVNLFE